MARKLFEKQGIRTRAGTLATGTVFVVYSDAAGTVEADISATSGGSAIAGATVTVTDRDGLGLATLLFYGPTDGTDTLFLRCPADTGLGVQEIEADEDERLDALVAASGIPPSILDAKGDIIAASAADTAARLAAGANDTVLTADSTTGTGLKWAAPAAHPNLAAHDSLGLATDAELTTHAAAADPHTGYVLESLVDAKGDLIAGSAADTVARLAVGTNGQRLEAASGQATGLQWSSVGVVSFARKAADESVTSSAVLQDDDHLTLAVAANATYLVELFLIFEGSTAGDFKFGFTVPASAVMAWRSAGQATTASSTTGTMQYGILTEATAVSMGAVGATFKLVVTPSGILRTAGTAGNLTLQWAQAASDGTATILYTDSYLKLTRVA